MSQQPLAGLANPSAADTILCSALQADLLTRLDWRVRLDVESGELRLLHACSAAQPGCAAQPPSPGAARSWPHALHYCCGLCRVCQNPALTRPHCTPPPPLQRSSPAPGCCFSWLAGPAARRPRSATPGRSACRACASACATTPPRCTSTAARLRPAAWRGRAPQPSASAPGLEALAHAPTPACARMPRAAAGCRLGSQLPHLAHAVHSPRGAPCASASAATLALARQQQLPTR